MLLHAPGNGPSDFALGTSPENQLMFMMLARRRLMLLLLHVPGFHTPGFQFHRPHDSRFQISRLTGPKIPDFQICTPQVSRDSRPPELHDLCFQIDLHVLSFQRSQISRLAGTMFPESRIPDLQDLCFRIPGFHFPDSQKVGSWKHRSCKSGHLESGNLRPAESRKSGDPDSGSLQT